MAESGKVRRMRKEKTEGRKNPANRRGSGKSEMEIETEFCLAQIRPFRGRCRLCQSCPTTCVHIAVWPLPKPARLGLIWLCTRWSIFHIILLYPPNIWIFEHILFLFFKMLKIQNDVAAASSSPMAPFIGLPPFTSSSASLISADLNQQMQFKCVLCNQKFNSKFHLEEHMRLHSSRNCHKCQKVGSVGKFFYAILRNLCQNLDFHDCIRSQPSRGHSHWLYVRL